MKDLTGKMYGRLQVLKTFLKETEDKIGARSFCKCLCTCGKTVDVAATNLKSGKTTSCGCKRSRSNLTINGVKISSRAFPGEYSSWQSMQSRCYDEASTSYKHYGGRGIKIYQEWINSFETFILDMGVKPTPSHQIDRINNDGDYAPGNCKWSTPKEQAANRSSSLRVVWKGEVHSLKEWAIKLGINYNTISTRYHSGKPLEEVFEEGKRKTPINTKEYTLKLGDELRTIEEWSDITSIPKAVILKRLREGEAWTIDRILSTPVHMRNSSGTIKNKNITYLGITKTLGEWADFLGKNYDTIKNRYLSGLPLDKILSSATFEPGRNSLRGENKYIGKRFGKLVITGVTSKLCGGSNRTYAICNCDCGTMGKEILMTNIVTGKQIACGCSKGLRADTESGETSNKKFSIKGIVGKRFDRLLVLEVKRERTEKGSYVYRLRCECDCGNETTINLSHLGRVKSCGCLAKELFKENRIDLTKSNRGKFDHALHQEFPSWRKVDSKYLGQKFNKLTILEVRSKPVANGGFVNYTKCECECGKIAIKKITNVTNGYTKSCGCAKAEAARSMCESNSFETAGSSKCKVGDVFGKYTVKEITKVGSNLYAICTVEGGGEKRIRVGDLKRFQ